MRFAGSDSALQSMFSNMSKNTPGAMENLGTETRSALRNAVTEGQFNIDKAEIDAEAIKEGAAAQASAARSQNQSNMFGSILGGISSGLSSGGFFGGGGGFKYGTTKMGAGGGSVGGMGTFGPNYGFPVG